MHTSLTTTVTCFLFLVYLLPMKLSAQSSAQIEQLVTEFKVVTISSESSQFEVIFNVVLSDTTGVSRVHIALGNAANANNYFSYDMPLNGAGLPNGVTLEKEGYTYMIHTGVYAGISQYVATAKLQYSTGLYSEEKRVTNIP